MNALCFNASVETGALSAGMRMMLYPLAFHLTALIDTPTNAAHLPLALLLVFGGAKLLAEVFERLGQPGIVGEILAGVLLGPSVLNWVRPDQVLTALAEMGIMFLLFRVGLEVKASELMRVGGTALIVAILGVVAPFVSGWAIMAAFGVSHIEAIFSSVRRWWQPVSESPHRCSPPRACWRNEPVN